MIYDWYKLFNRTEFEATGLVQRNLILQLQDRGVVNFTLNRGNTTSIQYLDVFLPVKFQDRNPYPMGPYAVYEDPDHNVWFGFQVDES